MNTPSVGRIVHYMSYGTPGGEYLSTCRAAVITAAPKVSERELEDGDSVTVDLAVFNPEGTLFTRDVPYSTRVREDGSRIGGTWHWPERV